jgi:molybdopterin converting factor subunit 1
MTVRVRLFARARDLAGAGEIDVEVSPGATVGEVRRTLGETRPALRELLGRCAIAVDENFAGDDIVVTETSEIAVIPPVSGGAC